jgi:hypothetical protein
VPSEVAPFRKVTVPAGVPPLVADTVAVSVRVWPAFNEVADEVRVVFVVAVVMVKTALAGAAAV